jgi:cytosine/adenosine deaminase-related metal-dependent hydrolase
MLLTATLIHNGHHFLPQGSVIEVNEAGVIVSIHDGLENKDVISYEGILCPGFVNVHCHLELSHMKGMIPEHTGLIPFLQKVPSYRTMFSDEQKKAARHEAYEELIRNGVVAVGDIANVTDTLDVRQMEQLHVHSFVETIGFTNEFAQQRFDHALAIYESFAAQHSGKVFLRQSIVPHAPYSVSPKVFKLINEHEPQSIISIHNQESLAENEFYYSKQGAVNDLLGGFGIDTAFFQPFATSSLRTYTNWLAATHPCIFIHNTYTQKEDVAFAVNHFEKTFWCLCPNANLYIEKQLPDVAMFLNTGATVCIGTDSLASNHQLSVLEELLTLKKNFPFLEWETLLQWATINGAKALDMAERIGSIEVGKVPGILNLTGLDNLGRIEVRRVA